jgi:hypothetical protein
MENESIGKRGMGINYKGSQGQTKRAVVLQEEEVTNLCCIRFHMHLLFRYLVKGQDLH